MNTCLRPFYLFYTLLTLFSHTAAAANPTYEIEISVDVSCINCESYLEEITALQRSGAWGDFFDTPANTQAYIIQRLQGITPSPGDSKMAQISARLESEPELLDWLDAFGEATAPVTSRHRAITIDIAVTANKSANEEELLRLSTYVASSGTNLDAAVIASEIGTRSIMGWVSATIAVGQRGDGTLSALMKSFGYKYGSHAVHDSKGMADKLRKALDILDGDPQITDFDVAYAFLRDGTSFQRRAGEKYSKYFIRLRKSGAFNIIAGHHIFPIDLLKDEGFRTWYELYGWNSLPINHRVTGNAPGTRTVDNLIMMENFRASNNLGTHNGGHPVYITTLRNFFNDKWNAMQSPTKSIDEVAYEFDQMMQILGPKVKTLIVEESIKGTTKLDELLTQAILNQLLQ